MHYKGINKIPEEGQILLCYTNPNTDYLRLMELFLFKQDAINIALAKWHPLLHKIYFSDRLPYNDLEGFIDLDKRIHLNRKVPYFNKKIFNNMSEIIDFLDELAARSAMETEMLLEDDDESRVSSFGISVPKDMMEELNTDKTTMEKVINGLMAKIAKYRDKIDADTDLFVDEGEKLAGILISTPTKDNCIYKILSKIYPDGSVYFKCVNWDNTKNTGYMILEHHCQPEKLQQFVDIIEEGFLKEKGATWIRS